VDTWIFLRGLSREAAHWGAFAEHFRDALPGSKVMTLNLPGNGVWHAQPSPVSVQAMVAHVRAELAHRGEQPPYRLLALSLGAMVATEWASRASHEVAACVLINTSFRPFGPFYRRLQPRNWWPLLRLALLWGTPVEVEQTVWRLTSNQRARRDDVVAAWVTTRLQRPVSRSNALRQLIAAARYRAPDAPPPAKLLLLASERDGLVHVACSQAIARDWGCPLALHPWAGHDLPLDDPQWVIDQVQRWLAGTPQPPLE
jgi:alpha-beta hydrolase superfamily lysophospholipase